MVQAAINKLNLALLGLVFHFKGSKLKQRLDDGAKDPRRIQKQTLFRILRQQEKTEYGRKHSFNKIKTIEGFRKNVPINDFESLRSYIEGQDESGKTRINREKPFIYTVTSGTTGKPKYIPVLKSTMLAHKNSSNLFSYSLFKENPKIFTGKILAVVSPATEGVMPSGIPFGSASGQLYEGITWFARRKYVVHPVINTIEDYDLKYLTILRLAIQEPNITMISTANPSTIVRLIDVINKNWAWLLADLRSGGFSKMHLLTDKQQKVVARALKRDRVRAIELESLRGQRGQTLLLKDIWPNVRGVATWTGGNSMIFYSQLEKHLPKGTMLRDLGYLSSEFRGTTVLTSSTTAGVPTIFDNYYEFVEAEKWDLGQTDFLEIHELEDKKEYYIFVTTDAGLYRYNMNDIVRVDGFYGKIPLLRFMQKGAGITSITGEKLFESQVLHAVQNIEAKWDMASSFYMMIADAKDSVYRLYYEPTPQSYRNELAKQEIEKEIDRVLGEINMEYKCKRDSGRLKSPEFHVLQQGTFMAYRRYCIENLGQRESQFKIIALQPAVKMTFDLSAHVVPQDLNESITLKKIRNSSIHRSNVRVAEL